MKHAQHFDVIVIGGGHAGCEAALASARAGVQTLLLTQNLDTIGQMSCNPAVGGIGKGHLVKEIDAMGGFMGRAADAAGIHFRRLNASKGPAVQATRAQADREQYKKVMRGFLDAQPNLVLLQQSVARFLFNNNRIVEVETEAGISIAAQAVVLTTGTFLAGLIHIGLNQQVGGRAGCPPSTQLAQHLNSLPLRRGRLKTGTPPRIDGRSIDFAQLIPQAGDQPAPYFSFMGPPPSPLPQVLCHITSTNECTHDIIRAALERSPIYSGVIESKGPRYCPSIEDKIVRFAEKTGHQIFLEPEGLNSTEIYPNGISTSLPFDVQWDMVRSIAGLKNAHITRAGYAIEYDYFDPRDLEPSLQSRIFANLFLAGQVNGTTGYEEAAAQGLIAGLNAARQIQQCAPWIPKRHEAYMGVLIDDLITRGAPEPYRMFTSRAEHRLLLREDNADLRLTETGYRLGLVGESQWKRFSQRREAIEAERLRLNNIWIQPASSQAAILDSKLGTPLNRETRALDLLRRSDVSYTDVTNAIGGETIDPDVAQQLMIQMRYDGYITRQHKQVAQMERHEQMSIPNAFSYQAVRGLSHEVRERLESVRPRTVGQASRIPGVTPAAMALLLIHLKKSA